MLLRTSDFSSNGNVLFNKGKILLRRFDISEFIVRPFQGRGFTE